MELSTLNDLMTAQELIKTLPLGRSTIYGLLQSGELKSKRVGTKYIVLKSELLRFFTEQSEEEPVSRD